MPCKTDLMIKKETDEIVKALDAVEFDSPKFNEWLNSKKFETSKLHKMGTRAEVLSLKL